MTDDARDLVDEYPWIDDVVRAGWIARGVVYVVVGITAVSVALQSAPRDREASPSGALGSIASAPGGRPLLGVLVAGMVLYVLFQLFSLALIRGNGLFDWWRRAGHVVASVMYSLFAWSATGIVRSGDDGSGSSLVERASTAVLHNGFGQWLVGLAGLGTIGAGVYYLYRHTIEQGFAEGLTISDRPDADDRSGEDDTNSAPARALVVLGSIGWAGRAVVIMLIGFFLTRAAVTFDPDEARGFDRALRAVADSQIGTLLVLSCALGLLAYGCFCIASHRVRTIADNEATE